MGGAKGRGSERGNYGHAIAGKCDENVKINKCLQSKLSIK